MDAQEARTGRTPILPFPVRSPLHPSDGCGAWQVRAHFKGGISDVELYQFFLDSDKASNLHVLSNFSPVSGFEVYQSIAA